MAEFPALVALSPAAIVVFAVLASVLGLVVWLVFLPFRMLGWLIKGVALLLALPFVAIFGVIAVVDFGAGMLMFLIPFVPIALIALGAGWLVRRNGRSAAAVAH